MQNCTDVVSFIIFIFAMITDANPVQMGFYTNGDRDIKVISMNIHFILWMSWIKKKNWYVHVVIMMKRQL